MVRHASFLVLERLIAWLETDVFFPGDVNHRWAFNTTHWQAVYYAGNDCCECGNMAGTGYPGARGDAVAWTEWNSGALMLFGGHGRSALREGDCDYDYLNDLYVNFVSFEGAVVTGAGKIGIYGTRGVFSTSSWPGGREGSATWSDKYGYQYIYGGYGYASTQTAGFLSDVWRWSTLSSGFTWVAGPQLTNMPVQKGAYGEASLDYYPSGRRSSHIWAVSPFEVVWIFGKGDAGSPSCAVCDCSDLTDFGSARRWKRRHSHE